MLYDIETGKPLTKEEFEKRKQTGGMKGRIFNQRQQAQNNQESQPQIEKPIEQSTTAEQKQAEPEAPTAENDPNFFINLANTHADNVRKGIEPSFRKTIEKNKTMVERNGKKTTITRGDGAVKISISSAEPIKRTGKGLKR